MNRPMEKRYRFNWTWNYEKEEASLNELSEQGLHFRKAGLISSKYERDSAHRYTYRMDYQAGLKRGAPFKEYLQLYEDAGWEYVSSYGQMWHYFRRPWEPGEPKLYTDRDSLAAHYKTIQRMMGVMLLVNLGLLSVNMTNLLPRVKDHLWGIVVPVLCIYALLFFALGYGYTKMGTKINRLKR